MTALLTREQYELLASTITVPSGAFIGGEYVQADSRKTVETINPATGAVSGTIACADAEDVDRAVTIARQTFASGVWSRLHPGERKTTLLKFFTLIEDHADELAVLETVDSGKPVGEVLRSDIPDTVSELRWHAEYADKRYDSLSPSGPSAQGHIVREPAGVVACVLPWNFPLYMVGGKLGPALSEGNSVIVKPSDLTPRSTLRLAELAIEAGLPAGVLQVLPGTGKVVGSALGLHPDVDVLTFTGSTVVGREFLKYSAQSNLKRVVLEMGGKSPFVLLEDFTDLEFAAEQALFAAFWNMGENCTANSRLIVPRSKKAEFLELMEAKLASDWRVGNPFDPTVNLGPLISQPQYRKVRSYLDQASKEGARFVSGDDYADHEGLYMPPVILDGVDRQSSIVRDEIFGPVTAVITADDDDEAIQIANDTSYGLQATLFTDSLRKAHKYTSRLRAGTVSVNGFSEGDVSTPFGGYKLSGFGGKENGRESHEQYTELKTVYYKFDR